MSPRQGAKPGQPGMGRKTTALAGREIREMTMRYKVTIASEYVAANVADTVSKNHGSWDHATDQVGGYGVVFITANYGEDDDLTDAMDDHAGIIEYEAVGQTEQLDDLIEALTCRGEFYHGGRVGEVAAEWLDAGFDATAAKPWMNAKVWMPSVAKTLVSMGRSTSELHNIDDNLIYAWCNGDKAVVWPTTDDEEAAQ